MEEGYKRGRMRWMDTFRICKEQLEKYGEMPLPVDLKGANGIQLRAWVANNRYLYRQDRLTEEQRELLDSIHIFDVKFKKERKRKKLTASERKWIANCDFCREMLEKYGDEPLPTDLKNPDNSLLIYWVSLNRQYYQEGVLTQEQREMLDEIGIFDICFEDNTSAKPITQTVFTADEDWLADFNLCKRLFETVGDEPISAEITGMDGRSIRKWCERNRIRYQRGYLSSECCDLLDSIGLFEVLCTDGDAKWYANFLLCRDYVEKTGEHIIPDEMQTANGKSLKIWLNHARLARLSAVQRRLLESAGLIHVQPKLPEGESRAGQIKWTYINMTEAEHEQLMRTASEHGYQTIDGFIHARIAERVCAYG